MAAATVSQNPKSVFGAGPSSSHSPFQRDPSSESGVDSCAAGNISPRA
jgi:hypothetical protein